ncbi:AraC family transcriptional regulator [Sporosarcina sp. E16_8]|uniref:AraC family transcriptional regulator n=1 Tax=Sporosarcina sp. E16_8 TaxID=2789295 RepID=UPI001A910D90|nr:AraC family transcriptional regulator [Sporosarcina sp. E16_8]MBO0587151.1 AraC family transcriptional regulator [Sporosarcina sp. E16_8]
MIVEDHLLLWNYASLKIIDVKRAELSIGGQLQTSNLSASTLFYSIQGRARLMLSGETHIVENGYVCHAGKGAELSISDVTAHMDYYLIEYKAHLPLPSSNDLLQLLDRAKPFDIQYGFAVNHASAQLTTLSSMAQKWSQPGAMAKLQVKSLFYQFVCELMEQLQQQQSKRVSPDMVSQAADYMDQNYAEPITAESLAVLLNCSSRTLQRLFKKRLSLGPIDYLIQVRIDKSKELLYLTNTGLKDVALAVGYVDSYYFSRLFKRYTGISPSTYREWMLHLRKDNPENVANTPHQKEIDPLNAAIRRSLRTIIHLKGELTLELPPKKIAVLDPQFMDHMLALDEQPAGSVMASSDQCSFPDYLFDKLRTIQALGTLNEPDLGALRALAPDMIICTEFHKDIYENLTQIAPTIMLKRNHDWRETLQIFGRIMSKELEAELVLQQYKHKTTRLKSILASKLDGQSVSMIRPRDNNIRVHTSVHRTAAILYSDLGLHPPKRAVDRKRTSSMIPLEGLPELDADHYFVLIDNKSQSWSDEIQNTTTWKNLRAVQQHNVYHVKANMWIAYYGPIAMNRVVDQVAETFLNTK